MAKRLSDLGSAWVRAGNRDLVGFGVVEEWRAYTLKQAIQMLEDMRQSPGWKIGYFSYDFGVQWQGQKAHNEDSFKTPLLHFVLPEEVRVYEQGYMPSDCFGEILPFSSSEPEGDLTFKYYSQAIAKVHHFLREGETYEVNFAHRFSGRFEGSPLEIFKRLDLLNPSPHACFLNFEPVTVVSCSPERLVRGRFDSDGRMIVDTRPIKGTVPRGATPEEDKGFQEKLLASVKEEAELNMIVDLARNDLGKVCDVGSVEVDEHRTIETYSHVHHTMSNVRGMLREGLSWVDVLPAVFPGGSITGAPKHRTMEIIDQLESCARGIYTGSVGTISPEGEFDFNILIRTIAFQMTQRRYSYHSGGAIVIDSEAESEWDETLDKAAVLREGLMS